MPSNLTDEIQLEAEDGAVLGATLFHPQQAACGTVILHGATAVAQRYYQRFARFVAAATGARVLTYDYRGIGRSRPRSLRGYEATLSQWATQDAAAAHRFVQREFGDQPLALVGHSFGGQLVGLLDAPREAAAALMVGAQLAYYGDWPWPARLRLGLIWHAVVPAVNGVYGYLPGRLGLGEDLPHGVTAQWSRWCRHPEYFLGEYPEGRDRFARFDVPTRLYNATDDALAPPNAVAALLRRLPAARLDVVRIDPRDHGGRPIGHFGFFHRRFAETLWVEAADFLRSALAGTAPRAISPRSLQEDVLSDLQYGRA